MESTSPVAILTWFLAVLAAAGSVYQLLATFAVWRWRSKRDWRPTARPAVTLLKPLCGHETKLYDNLASFCRLDHPTVQIVFGVRDSKDAAIETVRRLQSDYPEADIELVIDQAIYGTNLKVSNLINMMAAARHDVLVLSDSDMSVAPDYLDHILARWSGPIRVSPPASISAIHSRACGQSSAPQRSISGSCPRRWSRSCSAARSAATAPRSR